MQVRPAPQHRLPGRPCRSDLETWAQGERLAFAPTSSPALSGRIFAPHLSELCHSGDSSILAPSRPLAIAYREVSAGAFRCGHRGPESVGFMNDGPCYRQSKTSGGRAGSRLVPADQQCAKDSASFSLGSPHPGVLPVAPGCPPRATRWLR